jgi:hypothetical protein
MKNTYSNMQKKYMKLLNSYRKKKEKLTVFDINFLLKDLIDRDQITFCGNNGKLEKNKYDIEVINLTNPKTSEQTLDVNNDFNLRVIFRLKNDSDYYHGDEILKRIEGNLININKN